MQQIMITLNFKMTSHKADEPLTDEDVEQTQDAWLSDQTEDGNPLEDVPIQGTLDA
jgi:hypothetical protein